MTTQFQPTLPAILAAAFDDLLSFDWEGLPAMEQKHLVVAGGLHVIVMQNLGWIRPTICPIRGVVYVPAGALAAQLKQTRRNI